jgi:hypothetical protein
MSGIRDERSVRQRTPIAQATITSHHLRVAVQTPFAEPIPAVLADSAAGSSIGVLSRGSPWRIVLFVGLPYWVAVSLTRLVSFELFASGGSRAFNAVALGLTPGVRAVQHALMLIVVLAAYRAALGIGWPRERRWIALIMHLGIALGTALISRPVLALAIDLVMDAGVDWPRVFLPPPNGLRLWASMTIDFLMIYLFGLVLIVGVQTLSALARSELERANLRTAWTQARLQAMRMQLNPHFVFNTFNTIATLLDADPQPKRARALVLALSDLYRRTLVATEREWMPISEELALASDYLRIQAARMDGRLTYDLECAEVLGGEQVPALMLQPLVENAVLHGVADDRQALHVWITVMETRSPADHREMRIEVGNSTDADIRSTPGAGVGLRNTRTRLEACYDGRATLDARFTAPGRYTVSVTLPLTAERHSLGAPQVGDA